MHIKTLVSAGALAIALGLGAPAAVFAQAATLPTTIGEQTLTSADAERVKVYCDDLQTQANQAAGADDAASDDKDGTTSEASEMSADTAAVGSVDMDVITLESCTEAGFITAP